MMPLTPSATRSRCVEGFVTVEVEGLAAAADA
jgi:hypothetical protein